jgi:hypothetical protein
MTARPVRPAPDVGMAVGEILHTQKGVSKELVSFYELAES